MGVIADDTLPQGTVILNRYRVDSFFRSHPFMHIYYGTDMDRNEPVLIREAKGDIAAFMSRIEPELLVADIPYLNATDTLIEADDTYYAISKRYDIVETLTTRLKREEMIPWKEFIQSVKPVICGLIECQTRGVGHFSISPNHFLYDNQGNLILDGFGFCAGSLKREGRLFSNLDSFSPPEMHMKNGRIGTWTDVYSMAVTIYRCITGVMTPDAMSRLKSDQVIPARKLVPRIPAHISRTIMKGMEVYAEKRCVSMKEFYHGIYLWH